MDAALQRVLDLQVANTGTAPSNTSGGGIISATSSSLQLVKQYTSSSFLAQMKSITVDSSGAQVNVLTQNPTSSTMSLTSFSVSQQNGC